MFLYELWGWRWWVVGLLCTFSHDEKESDADGWL